MNKNVKNMIN